MEFRNDFIWGAATSAYQIEGAADVGGKGESIWDAFCKEPGRVRDGDSGITACDHLHRMRQDVQLMKELGIRAYRFSVSWPRLLPEGTGRVNEAGAAFYSELIDCLLDAGIEPYLTLYHWDLPLALARRGGWMNPDIVRWFGEYAGLVGERFGSRVSRFFTINEPQCFIGLGYQSGVHAPGERHSVRDTLLMAHHVLMAHGRAVQMLREKAGRDILIGLAPTCGAVYPASESPEDVEAARKVFFSIPEEGRWTWNVSWWSDPVFLGHYPEEGLRRFHDVMPDVQPEDMRLISEPLDFYGQNIYNGWCVRAGEDGTPVEVPRYPGFPRTASDWPVTPEALRWGPRFLWERYHMPLYITENGAACTDVLSLDGQVHDPQRIDFVRRYLRELRRAADDGADIRGYFYWSLLDNFEWHDGYSRRFGLVYVDYRDQRRIPKDSAFWYGDVIRSNGGCL